MQVQEKYLRHSLMIPAQRQRRRRAIALVAVAWAIYIAACSLASLIDETAVTRSCDDLTILAK